MDMKQCNDCGESKPLSAFYARTYRTGRKSVRAYCKPCADARHTRHVYEKLYGLDLDTIPVKPKYCQLCGRESNKIVLDHCHTTKRFRGWLCDPCNRGLGLLGDSAAILLRAAAYVTKGS